MNEENINYISSGTLRVPETLPVSLPFTLPGFMMWRKKLFYASNVSAELRLSLESKLQGEDDRLLPLLVTSCRVCFFLLTFVLFFLLECGRCCIHLLLGCR